MNSKAIRKQLLAAVAMVLVAAVALGSSTYAWFASNNQVKANMSSIKATSDAAFLEISKTATTAEGGSSPTITWNNLTSVEISSGDAKELLPARYKSSSATMFETAFANDPEHSTEKNGTAIDVSVDALNKYVWKETVYIRAQSGTYNHLSVNGLEITKTGDTSALITAGRILAVCGDKVQLWKNGSVVSGDEYLLADDATLTQDNYATVDLYFYYDGDDSNVFTNNLDALKAISASVSFSAQQVTT